MTKTTIVLTLIFFMIFANARPLEAQYDKCLLFGMSAKEVVNLWGKPTGEETTRTRTSETTILRYVTSYGGEYRLIFHNDSLVEVRTKDVGLKPCFTKDKR